jgi:hypothetical protein
MSLIRRSSAVLVGVLSGLFLTTCAVSHSADVAPAGGGNPCMSGNGSSNRQAPIVCVDDSNRTLTVSPDPVRAHHVLESDRKSPVMIHWWTRSGTGALQLEIEPGCVAKHQCDSRTGHCWAQTLSKSGATCKYDVWIEGGNHDRLDPTIVVDACCG